MTNTEIVDFYMEARGVEAPRLSKDMMYHVFVIMDLVREDITETPSRGDMWVKEVKDILDSNPTTPKS